MARSFAAKLEVQHGAPAQSLRDTAPRLPSNVEFMHRISGLASLDDVRHPSRRATLCSAPAMFIRCIARSTCRTPTLVAQVKYNPAYAYTYTAEGVVGIGAI
jgi:urea carboxylase